MHRRIVMLNGVMRPIWFCDDKKHKFMVIEIEV